MPAGVGPLAVAADEDFAGATGGDGALAVGFRFNQIVAPDNGHIAKELNLGARELDANEFSSAGLKVGGGLKDLGLVLPPGLATAHDNSVRRDQGLKSSGVVGEPGPPDALAHFKDFVALLWGLCPC